MADLQRIFDNATAAYRGTSFAGDAAMGAWSDLFSVMQRRLVADGTTTEEQDKFKDAILAAIGVAPDSDLNDVERTALRDALLTAFDKFPRTYPTTLAPKAHFLKYVDFSN